MVYREATKMKITKKQLKELIREQIATVLDETEWRDVYDQKKYFSPQSKNVDTTEASMTPNKEVEAENALMAAVDALAKAGYTPEEVRDLLADISPEQEETPEAEVPEEETLHLSAPPEKPKYNWHASRHRGKKK